MRPLRTSLLLALLLVAAGAARAQAPFDYQRDQGFGAIVGLASGTGITYQEVLPNALGYRVAFLGWKVGDSSFLNLGFSGMRVLSDEERRRIYVVGSSSWWYDSEEKRVEGEEVDDTDDSWAFGLGVGVDLPLGQRGGFTLEGLFTYWTDSGDLLPLPQIGLHYHF